MANIPLYNIERNIKDVDTICRKLTQGSYYSILGPKFFGKTAFLHQILDKLKNDGYKTIYIDLKDFKYLTRERFILNLKIMLETISGLELSNVASIDDIINKVLAKSFELIIFFLDDIDSLDEFNTRELLHAFRGLSIQSGAPNRINKISAVFAGAKDLLEFNSGQNSPIRTQKYFLKELKKPEARGYLTKHRLYKKDLFNDIYDDTKGHPYLMYYLSKAKNNEELSQLRDELIGNGERDSYLRSILDAIRNDNYLFDLLCNMLKGITPANSATGKSFLTGLTASSRCEFSNNIVETFLRRYFDNARLADYAVYIGNWNLARDFYSQAMNRIPRSQETIDAFGQILLTETDPEKIYTIIEEGAKYILGFDNPKLFLKDKTVLKSTAAMFEITEDSPNEYVQSFLGSNNTGIDRHHIIKSSNDKIGLLVLE